MYAFVINHFGNKPEYLKYEIYFLYSLRNNTKNDISAIVGNYINNDRKQFADILLKIHNYGIISNINKEKIGNYLIVQKLDEMESLSSMKFNQKKNLLLKIIDLLMIIESNNKIWLDFTAGTILNDTI